MARISSTKSLGDGHVFGTTLTRDTRTGVGTYLTWFVQVGALVFLACALFSFDAGDWPGASVYPHNDPARNWCGVAGAVPAYFLLSLLGAGAWVLVMLWGLYLFVTGFVARVGHPVVRGLGGVLIAAGVAGVQALHWPQSGAIAGLGGGSLGTVVAGILRDNFSTLGSTFILLLVVLVGAVVALDVWVIIAPAWAARQVVRAGPPLVRATSATAAGTVGVSRRLQGMAGEIFAGLGRAKPGYDETLDALGGEDEDKPVSEVEAKKKRAKKEKAGPVEVIDENAGGIGGTQAFDPQEHTEVVAGAGAGAGAEVEDDAEDEESEPTNGKKGWTPEELRAKIARLPLQMAGTTSKSATQEDLRDIQSMGDLEGYKFPGLDQLEEPEANFSQTMEAYVREQAGALERALKEYRIDGEVVGIQSGPVITNYEIRLAPGTKVSALTGVASDLARSLKAVNVRIVSNTAGRDTVGVEVPNAHKEKVRLKELMGKSAVYSSMTLPMFLGKDASGEPLIQDLAKMPHMLIAGTTGSGKSVCMSSILMSFLYTKKPNELKLVLVDPKMVELSQFKDIPHLMCPVVTEMGKAAAILEWAVRKMDERYELLAEAGVNAIASYNALSWEELRERFNPADEAEAARIPKKLPYMVFVIDELADLMMTNKEVETSIIRLAQKARAVGMHLILATQRPQANVVTGLIKSNMPSRIAFKVSSGMDSRIVMDQKGAELLLGQGDMLFLSPRSSELTRAQGTLVDDKEIRRVVKFLREIAQPSYERSLMQIKTGAAAGTVADDTDEAPADPNAVNNGYAVAQQDDLFEKAVDVVMETKVGSVSMLQRRLAIGYTRSARLIELMGHVGILGAHKGTQAREVVMGEEEWQAMKAQMAADREAGTSTSVPFEANVAGEGAKVPVDDDEARLG